MKAIIRIVSTNTNGLLSESTIDYIDATEATIRNLALTSIQEYKQHGINAKAEIFYLNTQNGQTSSTEHLLS